MLISFGIAFLMLLSDEPLIVHEAMLSQSAIREDDRSARLSSNVCGYGAEKSDAITRQNLFCG